MSAPANPGPCVTADGRIWIDFTDHEVRQALWFWVPNFYLKSLHSFPLTNHDGSPTGWAAIEHWWRKGRDRQLWVRQAWRHADRGHPHLRPFSYSENIDLGIKRAREERKLPPLPDHIGTWNPPATMPPSACKLRLEVKAWRRCRLQSLSNNDVIDHGVWRGEIRDAGGNTDQGYRREAGAGEYRRTAREAFRDMWEAHHGEGAWQCDPEILVVSFKPTALHFVAPADTAPIRAGVPA